MFGTERANGGHKIIIRHVETLRDLGFDALAYLPDGSEEPRWFEHNATFQVGGSFEADDIFVVPEDARDLLKQLSTQPQRKFVFCQNPFYAAALGLGQLSPEERSSYREFIACGYHPASWLAKFFPGASVSIIPAFADERRFAPSAKARLITCTPRKRELELRCIQFMFHRLYPHSSNWQWAVLRSVPEDAVAQTFARASVFLSLNRFEGTPITSLEAMKSGCVVAGFTGLGGREYSTSANGFWVDEDDCEACARALVDAARIVDANGPGRKLMALAAERTADTYSYSNFRAALSEFWRARTN